MKAVIFDCFGVLYPDAFWVIVNKFVPEWDIKDPDMFHGIVGRYDANLIDRDTFYRETAEACGLSLEQLHAELDALGSVDMELLDYILELRQRHFKTSVLSNVGRGLFESIFEHLDPKTYFDDLVLSGEVGYTKPDHEIFKLAAERLQLKPSECVFVDDRERFCTAAEAAGMKAVQYKSLDKLKKSLEPLLA